MKKWTLILLAVALLASLSVLYRFVFRPSPASGGTKAQVVPLCQEVVQSDFIRNLPPPPHRTGIGTSHFSITTTQPAAQRWFDQGINLLHDFWHIEAYRAFREVIKADPTCAMGYWGLAMCEPGFGGDNRQEWQQAIEQAMAQRSRVSPSEKALIEASSVLVHQGVASAKPYFQQLLTQFANSPELVAFSTFFLRQAITTPASSDSLKLILEQNMARFPNHTGLQHYYIHVMEIRPDFRKAIPVANRLIASAPQASHIRHMPGHLYFLAGDYAQTAETFEAALAQEKAYHTQENIPYHTDQNYLHNLHYLTLAYCELGNQQKALERANQYATVQLTTAPSSNGAALMLHYKGIMLPALVHLRFRQFDQASLVITQLLNKQDQPIAHPLVRLYLEALNQFCLGMQALEPDKLEQATSHGQQLTQFMQQFEQQGATYRNSSEFKAINDAYDYLSMARFELAGWIDNLNPQVPFNELAWQEALNLEKAIPYDEPPRLMYPVGESLGRLHAFRAQKCSASQAQSERSAARKAYALALQKRPKSPYMLQLLKKV